MKDEYEMREYTVTLRIKVYDGYQEHPTDWQWENLIDGTPPIGYKTRESIRLTSCKEVEAK